MMEGRDGRKEGRREDLREKRNSRNKEGVVITMKGKRREEERAERKKEQKGRLKM